jgi:ATP-dependent phosphofructokinase / diphosphate-dependent phosphofructokinase
MSAAPKKLAILAGGGPAPGINSVIGAATIRASLEGTPVLGIMDGFRWIMRGDLSHTRDLTIEAVSRIHFRGGSFVGISRENPTKEKAFLERTVTSLLHLNVDKLITIGGEDTVLSSMKVEAAAKGRIRVVHVPKTIDNDLDLPHGIPTFGFQTARHYGVDIVRNLMVDAVTSSRWYFAITMGRKAGHLALGIGKAAGATLTLIGEEFPTSSVPLAHVVDILVGSVIKRLSYGRTDGVAVLAEGLAEKIDPADLKEIENAPRDEHGNVRLAEIDFGDIVKRAVQKRLKDLGIKTTIVAKDIGYELRCADPIPYDMEYTRDLGFCAAQYILDGGNAAMVSIQQGHFVPLFFKDMLDPQTGRAKVRMVDVASDSYYIARRYMLRLNQADFDDQHELAKLAATANLSLDDFRAQFAHVIEDDPLYHSDTAARIKVAGRESNQVYDRLARTPGDVTAGK